MAITTYAELQTAIANFLGRSDLTDRIKEFIELTEAALNKEIIHRRMETRTTVATIADNSYAAQPSDFVEAISLVVQGSTRVVLQLATAEALETEYASASTSKPEKFTLSGTDFHFGPKPDAVYTIDLKYYAKIPSLSDAATTNWLITNHPDVYLYGSLLQAAPYMVDDERIPVWGTLLERALQALKQESTRAEWKGGPTTIRVEGITVV